MREIVAELRKVYVVGTKVMLDRMVDEPNKEMVSGLTGIVTGVDDGGSIHVKWENGSSLAVLYKVDACHII